MISYYKTYIEKRYIILYIHKKSYIYLIIGYSLQMCCDIGKKCVKMYYDFVPKCVEFCEILKSAVTVAVGEWRPATCHILFRHYNAIH